MVNTGSWKVGKPEDSREILTKVFSSNSLKQSLQMAEVITAVIIEHNQDKDESQLSLSSRDVLVVLHGYSKDAVPGPCYELAKAIDNRLARVN